MSCEREKQDMQDLQDLRDQALDAGSHALADLVAAEGAAEDAWADLGACMGDSEGFVGDLRRMFLCGSEVEESMDKNGTWADAKAQYEGAEANFETLERALLESERAYCDCIRGSQPP